VNKLLTIKQLSQLIEFSPKTIYQWTHAGFIPHYKFRKGLRFREADIEEWLKRRRKKGRSSFRIEM
jgi:excisionase family DNA binding protein